ncbi:hypothetical protein ACO0QE_001204 [Hanseniaspora vineae]
MLGTSISQGLRLLCTTVYLLNLVLTIPIAFQIGGIDCGLLFTVTLFSLYFITTTIKVLFFNHENNPQSKNYGFRFFYYLQHVCIPPILMIFLNLFSKINYPINLSTNSKNILLSKTLQNLTLAFDKLWPYYIRWVMQPWKWIILHSTPYFTLLEGIFTILAIQTIGKAFKWLNTPSPLRELPTSSSSAFSTKNTSSIKQRNSEDTQEDFDKLDDDVCSNEIPLLEAINEKGSVFDLSSRTPSSSTEQISSLDSSNSLKNLATDVNNEISFQKDVFDAEDTDANNEADDEEDDLSDIRSITSISSTSQERSNLWSILGLLFSACVITLSLYYLYKIYATPNFTLTVIEATLIGFTFSGVCGVGLYGIISGKGSVIESSLLFAYVIRCIYEISPVLSDEAMKGIMRAIHDTWSQVNEWALIPNGLQPIVESHNFPIFEFFNNAIKSIKTSTTGTLGAIEHGLNPNDQKYHELFTHNEHATTKNLWDFIQLFTIKVLPNSIVSIYKVFGKMVKESITPSVLINLSFRLLVFYSATRIIPALQKLQQKQKLLDQQHQEIVDEYLKPLSSHLVAELEHSNMTTENQSSNGDTNAAEKVTMNQEEGETQELDTLIRKQQQRKIDQQKKLQAEQGNSSGWMDLLYLYSPCILIAMYTHLILQYSRDDTLDNKICLWGCIPFLSQCFNTQAVVKIDSWGFWNWINIFTTVFLYAFELGN